MTTLILTIAIAHILVVITPGPNFLVVAKTALGTTSQQGILVALGVASVTVVYGVLGFWGVIGIVGQSALLFGALKILGGLYLIYLGVQAIRHGDADGVSFAATGQVGGGWSAYRLGMLTQATNPKAALYFLTLFTTLVPPDLSVGVKLGLIAMLVSISLVWYTLVAFFFASFYIQRVYLRAQRWTNYALGGLFISLGLRVAAVR